MGIVETIALSMGLAWASGINLYATLAALGILSATGNIVLPEELLILGHPAVIAAASFMYCVEFFADKVPGVDTGWDALHSFIRIPAGAILAASALGDVTPAIALTAAILGGGLAATSHTMKAGTRVLINTSPEPFSNWTASLGEDVLVLAGLGTALFQPTVFLALLVLFIVLAIWLLPRIWRGIKVIFAKIGSFFGARSQKTSPSAADLFNPTLVEGPHTTPHKASDEPKP